MPTVDKKSYFAEYNGKIYCFGSISLRNLAVNDYGFTSLTSRYMYKNRPPYIIIPEMDCKAILDKIKEQSSDHE